jgi:hypothetical protein
MGWLLGKDKNICQKATWKTSAWKTGKEILGMQELRYKL